jgi:SAM-dependent methyltransferase
MGADGHLQRAAAGFAEAERYERARPHYPDEAVDHLCAVLGVGPGRRVLDLAAGTGKLTLALVTQGAEVIAVEPVGEMRERLAGALPGIRVLAGTAEAIPLDPAAVDVVTVAQAFHWFDGPAAIREIHRVLRPGGRLGLLWNVMDQTVPWVERLQERIHRHRGANPWYTGHGWRRAFDDAPEFSPLRHRAFRNVQLVDRAGLLDRIASISFIATLDPPAREAVFADALDILAADGLPGPDGRFEIPYVTDVFWCTRQAVDHSRGEGRPSPRTPPDPASSDSPGGPAKPALRSPGAVAAGRPFTQRDAWTCRARQARLFGRLATTSRLLGP